MDLPADLKYSEEHEWCRVEGDTVTLGITFHAQDALGEIVYFEAPATGTAVGTGDVFCVVESVKTVGDIYAPVDGEIVEVNEVLETSPEKINNDPYGDGWLVKLKVSDSTQVDALMDATAYGAFLRDS